MTTRSIVTILFLLFAKSYAQAQSDSATIQSPDSSYFIVNMNYDSKVVFQGRTDGINQFGITPSISYQNKKGFNASYSASFWSADSSQPALHNLGLGWDFDLSDTWSLSLNYARWILGNGDAIAKSALNNNASIDISYAPGTWSFTALPSVTFGSSTAFSFSFSASKFFIFSGLFTEKDRLLIIPTFSTTLATENRFSASRVNLKKLKNSLKLQTFQATAYELTLPIKYKVNKNLSFGATFHYAVPLNLALSERTITALSYFSLSSGYKF